MPLQPTLEEGGLSTIEASSDPSRPDLVELPVEAPEERSFRDRYQVVRSIGEGGMGEVLLCRDVEIGRHIAIKVIRSASRSRSGAEERFVREARVQGQLEHPSIVPVYDLGVGDDGNVYFSMKRVRGVTLEEILRGLRDGKPGYEDRFSEHKMLSAFASVCLSIHFAHRRGVVHRDLKPSNIMLGDYGEVYVLDWGLAKLSDADDMDTELSVLEVGDGPITDPGDAKTEAGTFLGTPGYMSPEQLVGDPVGPSVDIYALGSVLFELLTRTPLHAPSTATAMMTSTIEGVEARPSVRAPELDVAPELEVICVKATAREPEARYTSARGLQEEVQGYLEGRRDQEQRQKMAETFAARALEALGEASLADALAPRRTALQLVGRALALDPDNESARSLMVRLLTEPPDIMPPEVGLEMRRANRDKIRWTGRAGMVAYSAMLLYLPVVAWVGVRDWTPLIVFFSLAMVCAAISTKTGFSKKPKEAWILSVMLTSSAMIVAIGPLLGPFMLIPPILVANTTAFALYLRGWHRLITIATGCVAVAAPLVLELVGVFPGSVTFHADHIATHSSVLDMSETPTTLLLTLVSMSAIVIGSTVVGRVRDALHGAEERLYLYAWHLREFVPQGVRPITDPTIARPGRRPPPGP